MALQAVVALFLIPLLTYGFVRYAQRQEDASFFKMIETRLLADADLKYEEKQTRIDYYRAHPVSGMCTNTEAAAKSYKEAVCEPYGETWQFHRVRLLSLWTLAASAVGVLVVGALGALAFRNRKLQYKSFVVGWRFMMVASAAAVILQGFFAVWLSFWVTAFLVHKYFIKLIFLAGFLALGGVASVVRKTFHKAEPNNAVEGELLNEADAPLLWRRIKHLAARLRTAPPDHVIAGIDTNFFVTESPLQVGNKTTTGRSLFMSIPLLRVLSMQEADAVLGHELAHFRGGDTQASAALGPKLLQYDQYVEGMRTSGLTMVVLPPDAVVPYGLSAGPVYRQPGPRIQGRPHGRQAGVARGDCPIFDQDCGLCPLPRQYRKQAVQSDNKLNGTLGIADTVAHGLYPYAASDEFFDDMRTAHIPHPFDSHPPLQQRMQRVGHVVPPEGYGAVVTQLPTRTWADDIINAAEMERACGAPTNSSLPTAMSKPWPTATSRPMRSR